MLDKTPIGALSIVGVVIAIVLIHHFQSMTGENVL